MKKILLLVIGILFLLGVYTVFSQRGLDSATREVDRPVREEMAEKIRIIPKPPVIEEEEEDEGEEKIVELAGEESVDTEESSGVKIIKTPYVTEATTGPQEVESKK